ncbi:MAG: pseudouridine synthase [Phycisphaerae bacterium]|nr:pseudouridine synthase [Phycisphaerae bacterium]
MAQQRLQKILAAAGVASRRKSEEIILEGAVRVNKQLIDTLPAFADPDKDTITVNGKRIHSQRNVYFLLNKPKGVICTSSDPQNRRTAVDLIPIKERIFCVGRLDVDTTGLIILTNDSELTNRLTHPKYKVPKTYIAGVKGLLTTEAVENIKKGLWLAEGKTGRAAVKILKRSPAESLVQMTISEGMNRQIRRVFARLDLKVKSLKRVAIGKITDKGLGVGKFRTLHRTEINYLQKSTANAHQ